MTPVGYDAKTVHVRSGLEELARGAARASEEFLVLAPRSLLDLPQPLETTIMSNKRRTSSNAALTLQLGVTIEEAEEMMRVGLRYYRTGAYLYSLLVNSDKRLDAIADQLGVSP